MKVVLFCGGLGTRIREYSEHVSKPMIPVGSRPMLWHVMDYYSLYGHQIPYFVSVTRLRSSKNTFSNTIKR